MAGIDTELNIIEGGIYGRDVRQAIHDGLEKTYNDASVNPIRSSGHASLDASNYQSYGLYDVDNFPLNQCIVIRNNITESMITHLPVYGYAMNILTYTHVPDSTTGWGAVQLAIVWEKGMFYRYKRQVGGGDTSTVWENWTRLASGDDVDAIKSSNHPQVSPDNYTTVGFRSLDDMPVNSIWAFRSDLTREQFSQLPEYGVTMTVMSYGYRTDVSDGAIQIVLTYSSHVYYRIHDNNGWRPWGDVADWLDVNEVRQEVNTVKEDLVETESRLSESIKDIYNTLKTGNYLYISVNWEVGSLVNGDEASSINRLRSSILDIGDTLVKVHVPNTKKVLIVKYNKNTGFENNSVWNIKDFELQSDTMHYYRFMLGKANDSAIEVSDAVGTDFYTRSAIQNISDAVEEIGNKTNDIKNLKVMSTINGVDKRGFYNSDTGAYTELESWKTILYDCGYGTFCASGITQESIVALVTCFDSDMHITGTFEKGTGTRKEYNGYVFTTPNNTKYVAVSGRTDKPSLQKETVKPHKLFFKSENGLYRVLRKYNKYYDLRLTFKKCGANNIVQMYMFEWLNNTGICNGYMNSSIAIQKISASDWVGPYVVQAVNNADGDGAGAGRFFTGGWHGYDNTQTGVATARTVSFKVYADGTELNLKNGNIIGCENLVFVVENRIQGNNTTKADGTGREILKEIVTYSFNDEKINVSVRIEALETVLIKEYYGLQIIGGLFNSAWGAYTDSSSLEFHYDGLIHEFSQKPCALYSKDSNGLYVIGHVNDSALGKQINNTSETRKAHGGYSNKLYFDLIKGEGMNMVSGSVAYWDGFYKFSDECNMI